MIEPRKTRQHIATALIVAATCMALGGCQSPMYSGVPDDQFTGSIAPAYSPGTYEPPAKIGRAEEAEPDGPEVAVDQAQPHYVYRGGRDPITGKAKTQL